MALAMLFFSLIAAAPSRLVSSVILVYLLGLLRLSAGEPIDPRF